MQLLRKMKVIFATIILLICCTPFGLLAQNNPNAQIQLFADKTSMYIKNTDTSAYVLFEEKMERTYIDVLTEKVTVSSQRFEFLYKILKTEFIPNTGEFKIITLDQSSNVCRMIIDAKNKNIAIYHTIESKQFKLEFRIEKMWIE